MQMYHHNEILKETIYDKNEYIEYDDRIEIILKNKEFEEVARTIIDKEDKDRVLQYKWYCHLYENNKKYCQGTLKDGYKIRLHQFVLNLGHNALKDKVIDHINCNSLDNRKLNLRIVTQQENMRNIKVSNPMRGIRIYETINGKLRYSARISCNYKSIDLGTYNTLEEAQQARLDGEKNIGQISNRMAERAAVNLCAKDSTLYNINDYSIYSNQWIPLTEKCTINEKIRLSSILDEKCSGGAIAHINIENNFANPDMAWDMLNYIASKGVFYFAFNTKINTCKHRHAFVGTDICPVCGERVVDTWQRIVGFLTPSKSYSKERFKEFSARQWYETGLIYGQSSIMKD